LGELGGVSRENREGRERREAAAFLKGRGVREGSCAAENLKLGGVAWSMDADVRAPDDGRGNRRLRRG
jgi:hypothetical protein